MSNQELQSARLESALRAALVKLQSAALGRDIADLTVNQQRQQFYQKQIDELLQRMKSKSAIDALSTPLTETYMGGFSRNVFTQAGDASNLFGERTLANFSIDTDKLRALTNAVLNPLQGAGDNLHSPLPYIAPNLDPKGVEKMLEVSMKGAAQGLSWAQLAKEIKDALPGAAKLVQDELKKGFQVEFPSGYRMPAERYAKVLARTQTVWAGNRGALDRAVDAGSPCMLVAVSPGTCDFCVALEGKVYAITAEASDKYGVPLLSACPNGGPPFHVNCRHAIAPFTPRKADAGKLPTAPPTLLTHADGKGASNSAQKAYEAILKKDPLPYAKQLAETAARRGFGDDTTKVPAGMGGKPVPDPDKGNVKNFPADGKSTLSEDVNLAQRNEELEKAGKPPMNREEYRKVIAQTLRKADHTAFDDQGELYYHDSKGGYLARVSALDGNVTTAYPITPDEWKNLKNELGGPGAPDALKPTGTPVSDSIEIKTVDAQRKAVSEAFDTIDAVHGDGKLKQIPIQTGGKYEAGYNRYDGKIAVDMDINANAEISNIPFNVTHEVGHWLDNTAIPTTKEFASEDPASAIAPVLDAIKASKAFSAWDTTIPDFMGKGKEATEYVDYLRTDRELFARAYAQFVAEQSGQAKMLKTMDDKRYGLIHWTGDDFSKIKVEMITAFKKLGWLS